MVIRIANETDKKKIFSLRFEVFVKEQNVPPEIEIDEDDDKAFHVICEECGETIGCARIIIMDNCAHIGRLAVKKPHRHNRIGSNICGFIINFCKEKGITNIWLNSQLHAVDFYEKLGFKKQGDIFVEAGIKHIKMELS